MSIFDISQKDRQNIANIFSLENIFNKLKKSEFLPTGEFDKLEEQLENVQRNISNVFTPDIKTNYEQYVEKDFISADEREKQQKDLAKGKGEQKNKLQEDILKLLSETYAPPEQFEGPGGKIEPYQGYFLPELISKPPGGAPGFKVGRGNVTDARGSFRQIMKLPGSNDLTNQIMRLQSLQDQGKQFKREATKDAEIAEKFRSQKAPGIFGLQKQLDDAQKALQTTVLPKESQVQEQNVISTGAMSPPLSTTETSDPSIIKPSETDIRITTPGDKELVEEQQTIAQAERQKVASNDLFDKSLSELALFGQSDAELTQEQKTERIENYKKQFFEATGIDPSGKPDMRDAMVAFGLALMQNKAGKKFDLGKIFGAVGKAGEKALPLARKAKKDVEAKKLAAGQFALSEVAKEEERQAQYNNEKTKFYRELYKERLKDRQEALKEYEIAKAGGDKSKIYEKLANLEENKIKIGATTVNLDRAADPFNQAIVFNDPVSAANQIVDAYSKTEGGLEGLELIESILQDIKAQAQDTPGGQIGFLLGDKGNKFLKLIGFSPESGKLGDKNKEKYFTEDGTLKTDKIASLQLAIMSRFKRFMTQETGNGISNVDVNLILQQFGEINFFTDFDKGLSSVAELKNLFNTSKDTLDPIILQLTDRSEYRYGPQGDIQFSKVNEAIEKGIFGGKFQDLFEKIETSDPSKPIIINVKDL